MSFYTGCPEISRSNEILVEWVDVGGERRQINFEKEVIWLLKSEAHIQFMHGGEVIKEGSSYNDFYGYMSSLNCATDDTKGILDQYSITSDSSLELVVRAAVSRTPCIETTENASYNRTRPENYKAQYTYVPDRWRQEATEDGQKIWPCVNPALLTSEIVWSSKNTPEQNADLAAKFRDCWQLRSVLERAVTGEHAK